MELNQQPKEKRTTEATGELDVVNIWSTIQGEGPFNGTPATFVRLAGCNLQCEWCDTDYTSNRKWWSPSALVEKLQTLGHELVVVTGGEPFRQNCRPFVMAAVRAGFRIQFETNGTLNRSDVSLLARAPNIPVTVVCSPKTSRIHPKLHIHVLKYVVEHDNVDEKDGLPTSCLGNGLIAAKPPKGFDPSNIYIQPLDVQNETANALHMLEAVNSCMKHGYRLCLQVHKIAGLP